MINNEIVALRDEAIGQFGKLRTAPLGQDIIRTTSLQLTTGSFDDLLEAMILQCSFNAKGDKDTLASRKNQRLLNENYFVFSLKKPICEIGSQVVENGYDQITMKVGIEREYAVEIARLLSRNKDTPINIPSFDDINKWNKFTGDIVLTTKELREYIYPSGEVRNSTLNSGLVVDYEGLSERHPLPIIKKRHDEKMQFMQAIGLPN